MGSRNYLFNINQKVKAGLGQEAYILRRGTLKEKGIPYNYYILSVNNGFLAIRKEYELSAFN